jgi:hypothetical protein
VELGVALPAGPVPEPGQYPTLGGHPTAHAIGLYPGHRGPLFEERQRLGHGLPVGLGHHVGRRLGGKGPQQRASLGRRKSHIESPHRAFPVPRQ